MNIVTSVLHLTLKRNSCSLFHLAYTYNTAPIYMLMSIKHNIILLYNATSCNIIIHVIYLPATIVHSY